MLFHENGDFPRTLQIVQSITVEATGVDVTDPFWDQKFVELYTVGKYCYLLNSANAASGVGACTYYNKTILEENGIKTRVIMLKMTTGILILLPF